MFKNKRVIIMGLGLHGGGVGAAKFFASSGARVLVTDLKTKNELKESIEKLKNFEIKYVLGRHRREDFTSADLIIKNPAVPNDSPYLKIAQKNKVPIETDISIFFKLCPAPIIGITGTRGKSTTAYLIYQFLKEKFKKVILAGNIRISCLDVLKKIKKDSLVVLELSSWQLEGLRSVKISPHTAVITNIMSDHLNRYSSLRDYIEAKKLIFKFQTKNDYLVLNKDDKSLKTFARQAKSQITWFSKKDAAAFKKEIKILGGHNLINIAGAIAVAKLFKIKLSTIKKMLHNFRGIEGRLELAAEIKGVKYYNDTCATIPEATIAAIKTFESKNIILIAGGMDKNLDYQGLAREISKKVETLILLPGDGSDKIERALEEVSSGARFYRVQTMKEAVRKSAKLAQKGEIVLLSPGAASFNLFKHEFDRGEQFKKSLIFTNLH